MIFLLKNVGRVYHAGDSGVEQLDFAQGIPPHTSFWSRPESSNVAAPPTLATAPKVLWMPTFAGMTVR
jgi:hypothetical protein